MKIVKRLKIVRSRRTRTLDGAEPVRTFCPVCNRHVEMLTRMQAAQVLEVSASELDLLIADRRVHLMRTITGTVHICKESLFLTAP